MFDKSGHNPHNDEPYKFTETAVDFTPGFFRLNEKVNSCLFKSLEFVGVNSIFSIQ
jgi:hypothetical protein